ncbi:hypothetical protein [Actinoplanes sp. NPDC026670]|uniref:AfsR/SARP family transcriptional regulator n=1 Tax=Actinoplanes sp. NPDC026670 TaxID=3154700 RepID=UPI0033DEACD8
MMDIQLLGPVRARRDGADIGFGSARSTAVLCVLALHAGHAVSRDRVIHAVWGEDAPAPATTSIEVRSCADGNLMSDAQ